MSGKVARRLRKKMNFSKKTIAFAAGLCLSAIPIAAENEVLVSVFPHFTKPFGDTHSIEYGIGGGLKVTYRPVKSLNFFAQGDYLSMQLPKVDPISIINGSIGAGYHLDVSDRLGFDFNVNIGAYNTVSSGGISGLSAGAQIGVSYKITPAISADVTTSATHFALGKNPLMTVNAAVSPGVTFNITKLFNSTTNVEMDTLELAPVFPVLYSWYENNSFGKVEIFNHEDNAITDVTVSFYQPQYMAHPKECGTVKRIGKGESATFDLLSFFNEQILELTDKTDTNSYVIVTYNNIGQKQTKTFAMDVPVYGRNNMSWDDDRRAAVFVSSKDPAAMQFAKYVTSIVRENFREDVPINIQYATGIFEALNEFGINYVVDPSSAFEDNVGTSSIDFLQFPYQTLMYKGGDCDDLSILFCSLFEAVGIRTAFITIPGHIFMAFDSGMTTAQAEATLVSLNDMIVIGDEVWVPLEITLTDEGFYKAHRVGAREWRTANSQGKAALYKMQDSWQLYSPISAPGATSNLHLPDSDLICSLFGSSIDEWSSGELKGRLEPDRPVYVYTVNSVPEQVTLMDTKSPYGETVIREDPFADSALLDVLALATNVVAVVPVPEIKEEDLEVFEDEEEKKEGDPETEPKPEPTPAVLETKPVVVEATPVVVEATPVVVEPVETTKEPTPKPTEKVVSTSSTTPISVVEKKSEPTPAVVEPTPVVVEPTPVVVEPTPVVVEPTPVVVEPVETTKEPTPKPTEKVVSTNSTTPVSVVEKKPEPTSSVVPEPVEGPAPTPVVVEPTPAVVEATPAVVEALETTTTKPEKKSPLAIVLLVVAAIATAGIFILAKKRKTKQKDGE